MDHGKAEKNKIMKKRNRKPGLNTSPISMRAHEDDTANKNEGKPPWNPSGQTPEGIMQ